VDTEPVVLELAGHPFEVTNPNKVFFTQRGDPSSISSLLPAGRGPDHGGHGRAARVVAAIPERRLGQVVLPEARAREAPRLLANGTVSTPTAPSRRPWSSRTSPT